jgi:hypothetical protein
MSSAGTDSQIPEAEKHFHGAGDDEAVFEVEGYPASLVRREPVLSALFGTWIALVAGLVRGLSRRERESTILFGTALVLLTALGWTARRAVTPTALPRRDAESPLIDAPPEMLV